MTKLEVLQSINEHFNKFNKLQGYKSIKHNKELTWVNDYFKDTVLYDGNNHIEKIWVLTHNNYIHHCPICGVIPQFRNYNVGYSKHCKICGRLNGSKKSAQLKKDMSPEILVVKNCKNCNNEFSYKSRKLNNTISKTFCSKKCATMYNQFNMSMETKQNKLLKTNKTNLEKYGDKWVVNSNHTKQVTKEKMGVEYPFQSNEIRKKSINKHFNNTGYLYPPQNPETVKKMMQTKIDRYGDFLIPMAKYKEYLMPSGKIVKIQGNEGKALDILIKQYSEDDIIIGRSNIEKYIGKIFYNNLNKQHIYYPDIYIKSINKIYEVKSQFTYNIHKKINELKKQVCLDLNINFEFMIIN